MFEKRASGKLTALAAVVSVLASTMVAMPVTAAAAPPSAFQPIKQKVEPPIPARSVPTTGTRTDQPTPAKPAAVAWPAAGTAEVDLASAARRADRTAAVSVGALPVRVTAPEGVTAGKASVEIVPRGSDNRLLLRVAAPGTGPIKVDVDYSSFRAAYGADWASRLRAQQLPDCALSTPNAPECRPVPLATDNDVNRNAVAFQTQRASNGVALLAVQADAGGPAGDYTASPLAASSTWGTSGSTGSFTWSYPMKVPPVPGSLVPNVALSYSSQSVDGHTAASNNQPSIVGEGFEYTPGFVERRYRACAEDLGGNNGQTKTGDDCWSTDNAVLSLNGRTVELIKGAGNRWEAVDESGDRIEQLFGTANGDDNGENWKLTSSDGTQYLFGSVPAAASTWTVPVYGNNPGEPCRAATFAASWCQQGWRWNLDKVIDVNGNTMSFQYVAETNLYGRNNNAADATTYHRGGYLRQIDYGTRTDNAVAPARVVFDVADRCDTNCATHGVNWPDTPWDRDCAAAPCTAKNAPTFWTTKRLAKVTTYMQGSAVDEWTLRHTYPDPGDGTRAGLWLAGITHTGKVGGTAAMPEVTFDGAAMHNRVDTADHSPSMNWQRLTKITTESGGEIGVVYSQPDCVAGQRMPASPENNTLRCYPSYWVPEGYQAPVLDWFHKYVVEAVSLTDTTGGGKRTYTDYEYLGNPAWHHDDDDGLVPATRRTWSQWRGYEKVRTRVGDAGEQTLTENTYFRGMHGDLGPGGTPRVVSVADSEGNALEDTAGLEGTVRETITRDAVSEAIVSATAFDPWLSTPVATRTIGSTTTYARFIDVATKRERTQLDGGRGWRRASSTTTFDAYGLPEKVEDLGDLSTGADDKCTRTTYARNTTSWIISTPAKVESQTLPCAAQPTTEAQVIDVVRNYYDGATDWTAAPTRGKPTKVESLASWTPTSQIFVSKGRTVYDAYGRTVEQYDALEKKTTTAFTPTTGIPTSATVTNPLGHTTTKTFAAEWGSPTTETDPNGKVTDTRYDPLGRVVGVWLPGRDRAAVATYAFEYTIRKDGTSGVKTKKVMPDNGVTETYELYDSLLRPRQTQVPAVGGGRVVTDKVYDSVGRVYKANANWYNDQAPQMQLVEPMLSNENQLPSQTRTSYDGAGRVAATTLMSKGLVKAKSVNAYGGDHVDVTPPAGGTATSTYTDVRGQTSELRQYQAATPTGTYLATRYTYNAANKLATMVDSLGNTWRNTYDLRGRLIRAEDPDRGVTSSTYDDLDRVVTTTDARNQTTAMVYDDLGRKISLRDGTQQGAKRAEWVYDTLAKGQLTSTSRWVGTNEYKTEFLGYTDLNQPTGTKFTIPASEAGVGGKTYIFRATYNGDGSPATATMPAGGGLASETLSHGYNTLGMPTTLRSLGTTYVTDTAFTRYGQAEVITLSTGTGITQRGYVYNDATGAVDKSTTVRSTAPSTVSEVNYVRDPAGNATSISDTKTGDNQCFRYDFLGRITEAWTPATAPCSTDPSTGALGGPAPFWSSYTYDNVGNRLTEVQHAAAGDTSRAYTYPTQGDGVVRPHAVTKVTTTKASGTTADDFGYDAAGNTTSRKLAGQNQVLEWDAEGRPAKITEPGGAVTEFLFDANGNRLLRRDATGTTLYLGTQDMRWSKSTGATTGTRYYAFGSSLVATRTPAGVVWVLGDHQGSPSILIDASTLAVQIGRQTPFGGTRGAAVAVPGEKSFVGGTKDPTGLLQLGARQYDPATGRFISVDPLIDLSDPRQWNAYAYANNSPVTYSDPSGQIAACPDGRCNAETAPSLSVDEEKRWWEFFKEAHDVTVELRATAIRIKYARRGGKAFGGELRVPKVTTKPSDNYIPGASAKGNGNGGYADIICWDCVPGIVYVWEVKHAGGQAEANGPAQLQRYIDGLEIRLKSEYNPTVVQHGPDIEVEQSAPLPSNPKRTVIAWTGKAPGIEVYRVTDNKDDQEPPGEGRPPRVRTPGRQPSEEPTKETPAPPAPPSISLPDLRMSPEQQREAAGVGFLTVVAFIGICLLA
ncbi:RHS repeat-associated core domain-containing protein [Actinokineospora enzanensis]|uniref:RHS repeat-associated core domain-containing protein n=1 Tax=Actinokineospora enzanensis TaxID=155975 RepID=UPI0003A694C1|nr:RHS repeat-associated core domain-containing protein [Actinokineospora enzanensis]